MKVTNEMVERFLTALYDGWEVDANPDEARVSLEYVLAKIPEPELGVVRFAVPELLVDQRVKELEAKLAKVREWMNNPLHVHSLQDILGGEG